MQNKLKAAELEIARLKKFEPEHICKNCKQVKRISSIEATYVCSIYNRTKFENSTCVSFDHKE